MSAVGYRVEIFYPALLRGVLCCSVKGEAAGPGVPQVTLDNSHKTRVVRLCAAKESGYITSLTHRVKVRLPR